MEPIKFDQIFIVLDFWRETYFFEGYEEGKKVLLSAILQETFPTVSISIKEWL